MEVLFFLQPGASVVWGVCLAVVVLLAVIFLITVICAVLEELDRSLVIFNKYRRLFLTLLIGSILGLILMSPVKDIWSVYKAILTYRGINSDNAEQIMDNVTKMSDLLTKKLEKDLGK